ncbi:MAG TPA: hypothetical protein VEQ37_10750 [Actinomycetota bacterium]|nr:hypothetical protein [Actinomycetota bacterium]
MPQGRPGAGIEGPPPVHIDLWIRAGEPLAGEMSPDGGQPTSFEGWLDLLDKLSELVASGVPDSADRRSQ